MKDYFPEGWLYADGKETKNNFNLATVGEAKQKGTVLESPAIMCDSSHNLIVSLGEIKGIIPREEGAIGISEGKTRDIALISRVGHPVCFVVTDIVKEESGTVAVLSRKKAQTLCMESFRKNYNVGDIIDARITHLEAFGAFCDIGCGNIALLPIDLISVSRISHPSDRFCVGQDIKAIIKSIDESGKITLSHKELLGTWEENAEKFLVGQTVTGIVRSIEDYGVFVELTPNLAGLAEPKSDVYLGEQVSVYIKSVIKEKMKIKLIIIDEFTADRPRELNYFLREGCISRWEYSPAGCQKQIVSNF